MTPPRNWADTHTFQPARLYHPVTLDAARRIVAGARHVHAIGARHSFNAIADTAGDLIDLSAIDPDFSIDAERRTVTAGAATTYGELAAWLQTRNHALHNTASLPHVTLAGAIATGTHGSGDALGTLSSAVAGLEMITAGGDLLTVRRGEANFAGMVVNLGALGVVTRVTLDIQPSYQMRQDAYEGLSWDTVLTAFDAVMAAGTSVSLMTKWSGPAVTRLWVKTRLDGGATGPPSLAHLGATRAASPSANPTPEGMAALNSWGVPGPWSERLPHFRPGVDPGTVGHLQSEYLLPRDKAVEAIALLRGRAARVDPRLLTTEVRSMAADDLWLSPASGRATIGIHFSWSRDLDAVPPLAAEIETMLLPLGARPHWGKILHATADRLAPLYPRLGAFRDLARSLDPEGKFRNAWLDRHVFGT